MDDSSVNGERYSGDKELVSVVSPAFPKAEQKSNGQQHTPVVRKDRQQHVAGHQQILSSSPSSTLSKQPAQQHTPVATIGDDQQFTTSNPIHRQQIAKVPNLVNATTSPGQ